ncbi:tetratricopeptide repeat protein [Hoeflea poritis]|uniref:Tetratricopeptide repeat protein n=1 Tax=Hoeflea poritis TaxID=2993659 RepID=A0ABT4VTE8_9HYPH|nr:tetratricopeptide repeat protein [Hoeflea poritis]MDA4847975.1 tetratricopeptide repeat protein [Hoeflea poritis]
MADRSVSAGGDINRSVVVSGDGNAVALSFGPEFKVPLIRRQIRANERRRRPRELDILDPTRGGLPLIGREGDIENLKKWLNADPDISVHALIGLAGAGKTRLAIELCSRIDNGKAPGDQGWVAGFLSPTELPALAGSYALHEYGWENSTLLVIDYAAQHYEELARWLDQLAVQTLDDGARLRILLLERTAPEEFGWWRELTGSKLGSSRERLDLFWDESLRPETLPGFEDLEVRRQIVSAALLAAKKFHGDEGSTKEVPNVGDDAAFDAELSKPVFANPLSLVMAGMIARESNTTAALSLRRLDAARHLASRELERLQGLGAEVDGKSVVHLAAFNVLVGGLPLEGLTSAVGAELNAAGLSGNPDAIADLFQQEFPVSGSEDAEAAQPKLGTIQPDLIAEGAVVEAFEKASPAYRDQGPAFVQRAYEVGKETAAAAIIRLLQDYAFALEDISAGEEEKLAAQRLLGWLSSLADGLQEPEALEPLAFALPSQTLVLREDALKITSRLAEHWMAHFSENKDMTTAYRAKVWANNHALRLSDLGMYDEALSVVETALNLARLLFDIDADAFRDDLAGSLNNLAGILSAVGRREDALAAGEEAVELHRALAAARPDAFIPDLAGSLNNLANMLSDLGRREDALAAGEEAVELYRALAAARPDAFIHDLAMSLNNMANMLSDLGRREDALAAGEEAVELYRALAAARPDAFIQDLAMSLNNLANMLSDLGRREDALAAGEEAVELYRALAAARSDAFIPDLAMSLNNLANRLSAVGRREDALAAGEEAVELRRTLAVARPDAASVDLSMSLGVISDIKNACGDKTGAFEAISEAIDILKPVFLELPQAVDRWMVMHLQRYFMLAKELKIEPDKTKVAPILEMFEALKRESDDDNR